MSAIHIIVHEEHDDTFQLRNEPNSYEIGRWRLGAQTLDRLINDDGRIYFHRTQADAPFRGGQLTGYRTVYTPERRKLKVICFLQDNQGVVGVETGLPGWSRAIRYAWN